LLTSHKIQLPFIKKVRIRPVINLNILYLIKLIEKCTVQVVPKYPNSESITDPEPMIAECDQVCEGR